jgi:hypothetical protein
VLSKAGGVTPIPPVKQSRASRAATQDVRVATVYSAANLPLGAAIGAGSPRQKSGVFQ